MHGLHVRADAADEPDQHAAVAELDEGVGAVVQRRADVWVKRTGAVSCWASSERRRSPFSNAPEVADRNGSEGVPIFTLYSASRSLSAAGAITDEWNAPSTSRSRP